jgi:hypothetical protein
MPLRESRLPSTAPANELARLAQRATRAIEEAVSTVEQTCSLVSLISETVLRVKHQNGVHLQDE